eukprot:gene8209-14917_t
MALTARRAAADAAASPARRDALLREVDTVACVSGGPPPGDPMYGVSLGLIDLRRWRKENGGGEASRDGATTTLMAQRIADGAPGTGGLILLSGAMHGNTIRKVVSDAAKGRTFRPYEGAPGVDVGKIRGARRDPPAPPRRRRHGTPRRMSGTREVFNNEHERRRPRASPPLRPAVRNRHTHTAIRYGRCAELPCAGGAARATRGSFQKGCFDAAAPRVG